MGSLFHYLDDVVNEINDADLQARHVVISIVRCRDRCAFAQGDRVKWLTAISQSIHDPDDNSSCMCFFQSAITRATLRGWDWKLKMNWKLEMNWKLKIATPTPISWRLERSPTGISMRMPVSASKDPRSYAPSAYIKLTRNTICADTLCTSTPAKFR